MTFESMLISTATIRRYGSVAIDDYGNPVKIWADYLTAEPCRISYPKGRQVQRGTEVVPVDAVLFVGDVDVTERDKAIVDGIEFEILFVSEPQDAVSGHHKELSLRRVIP